MSKFSKFLTLILGIFIVICGFYCLFTPDDTYLMLGYVVGISMVLDAIGGFIIWGAAKKAGIADGWMLIGAILSAVFGFFILNDEALQLSIDAFIAYYIAIWLVVRGIFVITRAWSIRRVHKNWNTMILGTRWYLPLCIGILMCLFGVLCCYKPLVMASTIGIFIGLGVISIGANLIAIATTPIEKY